ncbi:hypothetical protein D3Z36_16250, partial [Lachnospiraceae bacterium]|nr:hypothetical protein [Lachnospiraceae bacterium]
MDSGNQKTFYKVFVILSDITIDKKYRIMKNKIAVAKWILSGAKGFAFIYADTVLVTVFFSQIGAIC